MLISMEELQLGQKLKGRHHLPRW